MRTTTCSFLYNPGYNLLSNNFKNVVFLDIIRVAVHGVPKNLLDFVYFFDNNIFA